MKKLMVRAGFLALIAGIFLLPALLSQGPAYPYSVVLNWTASTSTGVTGQNVYRAPYSASACGTYTLLTSTPLASTSTTYSDTTAAAGQQYCYGVTALVGAAESGLDLASDNPVSIPPAPQTGCNATVK